MLAIFGLMGQVAWVVENMYFNVFIYNVFNASADDISLMVSAQMRMCALRLPTRPVSQVGTTALCPGTARFHSWVAVIMRSVPWAMIITVTASLFAHWKEMLIPNAICD